jgi:ribosomal protein L13E
MIISISFTGLEFTNGEIKKTGDDAHHLRESGQFVDLRIL